ncbi:MAG: response regulator [Desulfobacterales bacterium]|nr:response regulator [Desulfobacterales bacterium]
MLSISILIIEDDTIALDELSQLCKKESFTVFSAQNGKEGYDLFIKEKPDVVISEISLPKINGLELLEKIKQIKKETPVIVITGYTNTDYALEAIRFGAIDYLKKPLNLDEFFIALGRARDSVVANKKLENYPCLLLADDEDIPRMELASFLKKEGYSVSQARNGEDVLNLFKEKKYEIALLDIKMPKMTGIEALHKMRKMTDDFEAIILTGYGDESTAIQALRDGAFNFLKKPVDLEELLVTIQKGIDSIVLKRAFKYKMRELELANQIITQLTEDEKNAIIIAKDDIDVIKRKCNDVLNTISDNMVIFDEKLNIITSNQSFKNSFGESQTLDHDGLIKKLYIQEQIQSKAIGSISHISENNLQITLMSAILKIQNKKNKVFLGIIK